jgi:hypothetical protein
MAVSQIQTARSELPNNRMPTIQLREKVAIQPFSDPEMYSTYGTLIGRRETKAETIMRLARDNKTRSSDSLMREAGWKTYADVPVPKASPAEKMLAKDIADIRKDIAGKVVLEHPQDQVYARAIAYQQGRPRIPSSLQSNAMVLPFKSGRASKFIYTNEPKEVPQGIAIMQINTNFNRL